MGSEKRKEGLLLAVFWLAAVILIGTAANRYFMALWGKHYKREKQDGCF